MSDTPASVSLWLEDLKKGDEHVGADIWNRYMGELIRLSHRKLQNFPTIRDSDEEDLAIVAFNAFLMGVRANRFEKLNNRSDLWHILVMLTERKAVDQIRKNFSKKRGSGKVRGESVFEPMDSNNDQPFGMSSIEDCCPSPEFAVQFADQVQQNLAKLTDADLREIVLLKLAGYTVSEIADQIKLSTSSIERKVRLIRKIWDWS